MGREKIKDKGGFLYQVISVNNDETKQTKEQ